MKLKTIAYFQRRGKMKGFWRGKNHIGAVVSLQPQPLSLYFLKLQSNLSNSNNGVTPHSSQPCCSICLTSLLDLSKLYSTLVPLIFGNLDFEKYDSFILVLSLLNLFVIQELSFCLRMLCQGLSWFSVKLGKHFFVYI